MIVNLFFIISFLKFLISLREKPNEDLRRHNKGKPLTRRKISIFACMLALLSGVTWVFGLFSIKDAKIYLQAIFCVLNGLYGIFLFSLTLMEKNVRHAWTKLCGKFKIKAEDRQFSSIKETKLLSSSQGNSGSQQKENGNMNKIPVLKNNSKLVPDFYSQKLK